MTNFAKVMTEPSAQKDLANRIRAFLRHARIPSSQAQLGFPLTGLPSPDIEIKLESSRLGINWDRQQPLNEFSFDPIGGAMSQAMNESPLTSSMSREGFKRLVSLSDDFGNRMRMAGKTGALPIGLAGGAAATGGTAAAGSAIAEAVGIVGAAIGTFLGGVGIGIGLGTILFPKKSEGEQSETGTDAEADADTDVDSDADTDSDVDADGSGDTNADSDELMGDEGFMPMDRDDDGIPDDEEFPGLLVAQSMLDAGFLGAETTAMHVAFSIEADADALHVTSMVKSSEGVATLRASILT